MSESGRLCHGAGRHGRGDRRRGAAGGQDRSNGLSAAQPGTNPALHEAFRQGLRDLGHVEGRKVVIEYRDTEGDGERLPALAGQRVKLAYLKRATEGPAETAGDRRHLRPHEHEEEDLMTA